MGMSWSHSSAQDKAEQNHLVKLWKQLISQVLIMSWQAEDSEGAPSRLVTSHMSIFHVLLCHAQERIHTEYEPDTIICISMS